MALTGALCCVIHTVTGFTNKSLRRLVAWLLGRDYNTNQMSYDLRRLRLHGIIEKIPGTNTYQLTPEGIRVAVFYTKTRDRILGPLLNAGPPTTRPYRTPPRSQTNRTQPRRLHHRRKTRHRRLKTEPHPDSWSSFTTR
ncbi:MAG: hypothetical protein ACKV2O_22025 [Acidimicrobiales bacterium]